MILNYNSLPFLSETIRDAVMRGSAFLYKQKDGFDDRGTSYILKITDNLLIRLDNDGEFILPPLESMPENADITNLVELKKD